MTFLASVIVLTIVTALACAIPGGYVVLRRSSMLVDGIGHAVLPGIAVGYLFTSDLNSPWLIFGAAGCGLLVVLGNEYLLRTGLLTSDAGQGLVFPALFSLGVILITQRFSSLHLDVDAVLAGDLNMAALAQWHWGSLTLGPKYLYLMVMVLVLNLVFLWVAGRALRVATFDPTFAAGAGIRLLRLNLSFMFLVSLTVTTAFHATGAILVIALMVAPAATAGLWTRRLPEFWLVTLTVAVGGALLGFWLAYLANAPTSAGMAVCYGVLFLAFFGARALCSKARIRDPDRVTGAHTQRQFLR